MAADHQRRRVGETGEQFLSGADGLDRIGIEIRRPVQMRHLAGVMGDIAGQQRALAFGGDEDAHVAGAVARRRDQSDFIAQGRVAGDQIDLSGLDHRTDRVVEQGFVFGAVAMRGPVVVFGFAEDIACVGKGRHPTAADQPCIPADVVDMQMRAQHGIDRLGRVAGRGHVREIGIVEVVPGRHRAARFVVADAGIDDDAPRRGFDHEGMHAHPQPAFLGGQVWNQPGQLLNLAVGRLRQDEPGAPDRLHFDDFGDCDLADRPAHPALLPRY